MRKNKKQNERSLTMLEMRLEILHFMNLMTGDAMCIHESNPKMHPADIVSKAFDTALKRVGACNHVIGHHKRET